MYFITICPTNEHNEIDDLASITLIDSKHWTQRTQSVLVFTLATVQSMNVVFMPFFRIRDSFQVKLIIYNKLRI